MKWLFLTVLIFLFQSAAFADSEPKQVQIESRIVETSNDFLRDTGFQEGQRDLDHQTANVQSRSVDPEILFGSGIPKELLDGSEKEEKGKVLSAPQRTTLSPNGTAQSNVALQFTPTVMDNGQIKLVVAPTLTQGFLDTPVAAGGPQVGLAPVSTSVLINSGETVVLGGLTAEANGKKVEKVPFLSDIPIMGALFKNKSSADQKRELTVLITPHIVSSDTGD